MGDPRDDPFIQHRVAVVVAGQMRGVAGQRPGVRDRQSDKEDERRPLRVACEDRPTTPGNQGQEDQRETNEHDGRDIQSARHHHSPQWRFVRRERPGGHSRHRTAVSSPLPIDRVCAAVLSELDEYGVRSARQHDVCRARLGIMTASVLNQPATVHRQERGIVGGQREAVAARPEDGEIAKPLRAEYGRRCAVPSGVELCGGDLFVHA